MLQFSSIKSISEWWENSKVFELTDDNFNEIVGKEKYVFIEFYTKWCVWCRKMAPAYEGLYEYYTQNRSNDVLIGRLETHVNPKIAEKYGIFSYPYLALFIPDNIKLKDAYMGDRDMQLMIEWLNQRMPIVKRKNLQGSYTEENKRIDVTNKDGKKKEYNGLTTDQYDYFLIEIEKMKKQVNAMQEDIDILNKDNSTLYTLKYNSNNKINAVNDYNDENIIIIDLTMSPKNCIFILLIGNISIALYFLQKQLFSKQKVYLAK